MAKKDFDVLMSIGIDIGENTLHMVDFGPSEKRVLGK